jgi:hypothetical protein
MTRLGLALNEARRDATMAQATAPFLDYTEGWLGLLPHPDPVHPHRPVVRTEYHRPMLTICTLK